MAARSARKVPRRNPNAARSASKRGRDLGPNSAGLFKSSGQRKTKLRLQSANNGAETNAGKPRALFSFPASNYNKAQLGLPWSYWSPIAAAVDNRRFCKLSAGRDLGPNSAGLFKSSGQRKTKLRLQSANNGAETNAGKPRALFSFLASSYNKLSWRFPSAGADLADIDNRAGRFIAQPSGYRAFFPAPLPPDPPVDMATGILPLLSKADIALGRLDGIVKVIPDPDFFVGMYVRREAVLSSQIEGTQSSLEDLLEVELEPDAQTTETPTSATSSTTSAR